MDNRRVSIDHYENFPVATLLCPAALRPAVTAIYHFARTADDIADEGDAAATDRLADLALYRSELAEAAAGSPPSGRWAGIFAPLAAAMSAHALPMAPLTDLLSAFEQDVVKHRYADRTELLAYCRRSAAPVGRLLLHLYGVDDAGSLRRSDAICTGLQLANFWQDLSVDTRRGRLYVPLDDCAAGGVDPEALLRREDSPAARALVARMVDWARERLEFGAPLVHAVPGRAGWELRLVVQGGLAILDKIAALDFRSLERRPVLHWTDSPGIVGRAIRMRRARPVPGTRAA